MHLAGIDAAHSEAAFSTAASTAAPRTSRFFMRSAALSAVAAAGFLSLIGCGASYRPVVSAINPVGPSAQPNKYAVAISSTGTNSAGLLTLVDFSGDTVVITAAIDANPQYLVLNGNGSTPATTGYVTTGVNGNGPLNVFDISASLISSQILETTLLPGASPVAILPQGTNTYVTETGRNSIAQFTGSPLALRQELAVVNPIYVVGLSGSPRVYAIGQGDGTTANSPQAVAIDTTTNTPTATLAVGKQPVYGVETADGRRAFVLNKGENSVSVINVQTNQLDTFMLAAANSKINVGVAPLWADLVPTRTELVVANAGTGTTNGSLSIISIPLCSATAQVTNPNCDSSNPVDAAGFGTILASPSVGINPVMVSVLQDGTRAYIANAGNPNLPCATADANGLPTTTPTGNCSVSVVNLSTNIVSATIPVPGRPVYIAATTGTPTGKVYLVCGVDQTIKGVATNPNIDTNARNMTIIRTDTDTVQGTISLQGSGVSVRVTAQ